MLVSTAVERLLDLLEKSEGGYRASVAEIHVNQAMRKLSRRFEMPFDAAISNVSLATPTTVDATWQLMPGSVPIETAMASANLIFDHIAHAWIPPYNADARLKDGLLPQLLDTYGDDEASEPEAIAVTAGRLWWRPILPAGQSISARIFWRGRPRIFGAAETPPWLVYAPDAVLYQAAAIACAYLFEDERIQFWEAAAVDEAEAVAATLGMPAAGYPASIVEP